jgi:hypothetical protein
MGVDAFFPHRANEFCEVPSSVLEDALRKATVPSEPEPVAACLGVAVALRVIGGGIDLALFSIRDS